MVFVFFVVVLVVIAGIGAVVRLPAKRAATRVREESLGGASAWTGQVDLITALELFTAPDQRLRTSSFQKRAQLNADSTGLTITLTTPAKGGVPVRPQTIPWTAVVGARVVGKRVTDLSNSFTVIPMTFVAISYSEKWLGDFWSASAGADAIEDDEPEEDEQISPKEQRMIDKYNRSQGKTYGELWQEGVQIIDFYTFDATGLVDAVTARASGRPEKFDE
jgi:hypothetical protein